MSEKMLIALVVIGIVAVLATVIVSLTIFAITGSVAALIVFYAVCLGAQLVMLIAEIVMALKS
ncbi:hypothetical protein [Lacticaseibacillus paracasei]|uniref:hypothetical protein n=1 Tax=Lacticaseibacillus paracasei TaxID=1597 RepID=UPI003399E7A1